VSILLEKMRLCFMHLVHGGGLPELLLRFDQKKGKNSLVISSILEWLGLDVQSLLDQK
jgi:hypothetical protein